MTMRTDCNKQRKGREKYELAGLTRWNYRSTKLPVILYLPIKTDDPSVIDETWKISKDKVFMEICKKRSEPAFSLAPKYPAHMRWEFALKQFGPELGLTSKKRRGIKLGPDRAAHLQKINNSFPAISPEALRSSSKDQVKQKAISLQLACWKLEF